MTSSVLITGASQGIGKATALLFAKHGYDVILAARQSERLEVVAEEVRSLGRQALAVPTDVRDPQQVQTLVNRALERFYKIDVLINNAGIYLVGPADKCSLEDWHQVIDTNLWGYIHTLNAVLPHFLNRGQGTIVNLGSIGGQIPLPHHVPYITSKYAITGLTEALHAELAPKGIHVCGIYPNLIKSSLLERAIFRGENEQDAQNRKNFIEQTLQYPMVEKPEDVAHAIWNAVQHQKSEILVGSAKLSKATYNLFPGLMQALFRRAFSSS